MVQTRSGMLERPEEEEEAASERFLKHCWEDERGLDQLPLDGVASSPALGQVFLLRRQRGEPQRSVDEALAKVYYL